MLGSVRGAARKGGPYRNQDSGHPHLHPRDGLASLFEEPLSPEDAFGLPSDFDDLDQRTESFEVVRIPGVER